MSFLSKMCSTHILEMGVDQNYELNEAWLGIGSWKIIELGEKRKG